MHNLSALYRTSLLASTAQTPADKQAAYQLRYQVYCVERGYEPCERFKSKAEQDSYDARSIHMLTRHRASGNVLGVTRLVPDERESRHALPIEAHQIPGVNNYLDRLRRSGMIRLAEVSRLAVTRDIGSRCRTVVEGADVAAITPTIHSQHVSMGLLAQLFRQTLEAGITHWVALADANLLRCYGRLGIQAHKIGPEVNFRGTRQPMLANTLEVWREVQRRCPTLATLVRELPGGAATGTAQPVPALQTLFDNVVEVARPAAACA